MAIVMATYRKAIYAVLWLLLWSPSCISHPSRPLHQPGDFSALYYTSMTGERWPWTFTLSNFAGPLADASGTYASIVSALGRRKSRHGRHRPTRAPHYALVHPLEIDPALGQRRLASFHDEEAAQCRASTAHNHSSSSRSRSSLLGHNTGTDNASRKSGGHDDGGLETKFFHYCLAWEESSGQWQLWQRPRNATKFKQDMAFLACSTNALQGANLVASVERNVPWDERARWVSGNSYEQLLTQPKVTGVAVRVSDHRRSARATNTTPMPLVAHGASAQGDEDLRGPAVASPAELGVSSPSSSTSSHSTDGRVALCFFGLNRSLKWTGPTIEAHILAPLERWAAGVTSEGVAASAASWAASTTATYAPSGPRSSDASGSSIRDTTTESTSSSSSTNHRDSDSSLLEASPSASSFFMRGDSSRVFDVFFHVYSLPAVLDNKRAKELNASLGSPIDESAFFLRSRRLLGYSVSDQTALDAAVAAAPQSAAAQNDVHYFGTPFFERLALFEPFFQSKAPRHFDPETHANILRQLNSLREVTRLWTMEASLSAAAASISSNQQQHMYRAVLYLRPDLMYYDTLNVGQLLSVRPNELVSPPPYAGGVNDRLSGGGTTAAKWFGNRFNLLDAFTQSCSGIGGAAAHVPPYVDMPRAARVSAMAKAGLCPGPAYRIRTSSGSSSSSTSSSVSPLEAPPLEGAPLNPEVFLKWATERCGLRRALFALPFRTARVRATGEVQSLDCKLVFQNGACGTSDRPSP